MPDRMVPTKGTKTDDYEYFKSFFDKSIIKNVLLVFLMQETKVPQNISDLARSKAIFGAVSMVITARSKTQILKFYLFQMWVLFWAICLPI